MNAGMPAAVEGIDKGADFGEATSSTQRLPRWWRPAASAAAALIRRGRSGAQ